MHVLFGIACRCTHDMILRRQRGMPAGWKPLHAGGGLSPSLQMQHNNNKTELSDTNAIVLLRRQWPIFVKRQLTRTDHTTRWAQLVSLLNRSFCVATGSGRFLWTGSSRAGNTI